MATFSLGVISLHESTVNHSFNHIIAQVEALSGQQLNAAVTLGALVGVTIR